ncbi:MAG: beta-1,6-N-acetylglucosaminyltransferase [Muribaculaceae bacterium]|nr:beta-1,6-N-acetylglucosaminyltransferase [Muribaculaceae bacterium]
MAHNNFQVLQKLLEALDSENHDIFVHIDKKVKQLPHLRTQKSNLIILNRRIDVRWGHVSQVLAEYELFKSAKANDAYSFYILLSGTHYPLLTSQNLYNYIEGYRGTSILTPLNFDRDEIIRKTEYKHCFFKSSSSKSKIIRVISNLLWRFALRLQCPKVNDSKVSAITKCSQWIVACDYDLDVILKHESEMVKTFKYSLCPDELFIPYIFNNSNINPIYCRDFLFQEFSCASPVDLTHKDFSAIVESKSIFARKFTDKNIDLIFKIEKYNEDK